MTAEPQTATIDPIPAPITALPDPGARGFDPTPYLRQIRGRGGQSSDYLDVRHRLLWLRTEHPDAVIATELIQVDDRSAVFKASVAIPGGGSATGHGSESVSDFADYVEKAETKALGRALNALGFGVQFAESEGDEARARPEHRPDARSERSLPANKRQSKSNGEEWTLFWNWAKSNGFADKTAMEKAIGKSIEGLSAGELQQLLAPKVQGLGATA